MPHTLEKISGFDSINKVSQKKLEMFLQQQKKAVEQDSFL